MCVWWCKNPKHGMKDTMQNVLMGPKSRQPKTEWRRVGHRVYNKNITKKIIKIQIWRFIVLLDFSFHEIMVSQRQSDACQFCRCCRSHLTWVKTCGKWSFIEMLPHLKGYASILLFLSPINIYAPCVIERWVSEFFNWKITCLSGLFKTHPSLVKSRRQKRFDNKKNSFVRYHNKTELQQQHQQQQQISNQKFSFLKV